MAIQFTFTIENTQIINGAEYTEAQLLQGLSQIRTQHNERTGQSLTDAEWLQWSYLQNLSVWYEQNKGAEPVAPSPVVPVARSIDARRLRLALLQLNLLATVETAIQSLDQAAQIDWQFATIIKADNPLVVSLATALSLDINAVLDLAQTFT